MEIPSNPARQGACLGYPRFCVERRQRRDRGGGMGYRLVGKMVVVRPQRPRKAEEKGSGDGWEVWVGGFRSLCLSVSLSFFSLSLSRPLFSPISSGSSWRHPGCRAPLWKGSVIGCASLLLGWRSLFLGDKEDMSMSMPMRVACFGCCPSLGEDPSLPLAFWVVLSSTRVRTGRLRRKNIPCVARWQRFAVFEGDGELLVEDDGEVKLMDRIMVPSGASRACGPSMSLHLPVCLV